MRAVLSLPFEVINPVTNVTSYNLAISTNIEMTEIINSSSIFEDVLNSYPNSAPILSYGNTYYFQVNSLMKKVLMDYHHQLFHYLFQI